MKSTACTEAPLGGAKVKKVPPKRTTTGAIGLKRKALEDSGPKKHTIVMPSSNLASCASSSLPSARPSPSYTIVGVRQPDGGYDKGERS